MKKIIFAAVAVCMVVALTACSTAVTATSASAPAASSAAAATAAASVSSAASANQTASASSAKKYNFGFSVPSLQFTYFVAMKTAIEAKFPNDPNARINVKVYDAGNNQEKQNKDVEDMISAGVDGIILVPITVEGAIPAIKYANEQKVNVITVDRAVTNQSGVSVLGFVGSDHHQMGIQAGGLLIDALKQKFPDAAKWNVVEIQGTPGSSAAIDRGKGMDETMAKESKIKVVSSLDGEFDTTKATSVAEDVLTAHPDLNAFICHNDMMAEGCYQALANANKLGKVVVIGIDGQEIHCAEDSGRQYYGHSDSIPG